MTDFTVRSTAFQVEKRSWLLSKLGVEDCDSIVLDISKFTAGTHFPNGFIPSGTPVGKVTTGGLYGPYDDAASDGRQTAKYLLFNSVQVTHQDGGNAAKLVTAGLPRGTVDLAKLPIALDANGQADLKFIRFAPSA